MFTKLGMIKLSDWQRALLVAIFTIPIGIVYDWSTQANYILVWQSLVKGAVAGGLGYIIKNWLTGANGNLLTNK